MSVLRIGIDARELLGDSTGVGVYLAELLRRWTARADAASRQFVLYSPQPIALAFAPGLVQVKVLPDGRGTWWEQTTLRRAARRDSPDVFFAPAYTAPLGLGVPLAVTIHDVSFAAHPEWFRPRERLRRRWLTRRTARAAAVIFTVSAFSSREIERHLGVPPGRIQVIPQGVTVRHDPPAAAPRQRLVLYVGSVFNRRRVPDLIAAFTAATAEMPDARLAIVGANRTWPHQDLAAIAAASGAGGRIDLRSYASDAELASLYARASAFVFLSEYEGFGLTPLEALAAGVPIAVLDTPVAREVYGDAAVYVDSPGATAAAIRTLLDGGPAAGLTLEHAPGVLARYSWDRTAERTLAGIERAAGRS